MRWGLKINQFSLPFLHKCVGAAGVVAHEPQTRRIVASSVTEGVDRDAANG
jgi:hypothetical protein